MNQRLKEYIEYYEVRMKKYENNPMYKNSYKTEKDLYDAIANCNDLNEFKEKLKRDKLPLKNAKALIIDQENESLKLYEEIKEPIKARGCREILGKVDSYDDIQNLVVSINELRQKNSLEQSVDGFIDYFYSAFIFLENQDVYKNAEVPAKWKSKLQKFHEEDLRRTKDLWDNETLPRAKEWDPNWKFDYNLIWEERHRRKIPVPDQVIKKRIPQFKEITG